MTVETTEAAAPSSPVTLVTQTRVTAGHDDEFRHWQDEVNQAISTIPGYLGNSISAPNPPAQTDWVIAQRFANADSARAWLQSDTRLQLLSAVQPILVGNDDVHLFTHEGDARLAAAVTVVISMRVKPDQTAAFVEWQRRIAAVEATFEGFSGYRLEPPVPGIQDDWTTMLRFDSDDHLEAWLNSPQRQKLLEETPLFSTGFHTRKLRTGFDPWFAGTSAGAGGPPASWKVNMVVLLMLYPTVFLFGFLVQTPLLLRQGMPFWMSLFLANAVSTVLLGYWLVPWANRALAWWLHPGALNTTRTALLGTVLVAVLYLACLVIFSRFPPALIP
jgi:antibiotic biosynthesis monooxygenase (ABM) superfamily enzyme